MPININSAGASAASLKAALIKSTGLQVIETYDHAESGNVTEIIFNGVDTFTELMIQAVDLSASTTSAPRVYLSLDGTTFLNTSGDYVTIPDTGIVTNSGSLGDLSDGLNTSARWGFMRIINSAQVQAWDMRETRRGFAAGAGPFQSIRIIPSLGGNFTGGVVRLLGR